MNLFRIEFKVGPTASHPKHAEITSGYLHVFLFDFIEEAAAARAEDILRNLPFEAIDRRYFVYNETKNESSLPPDGFRLPWLVDCLVQTHSCGFSFHFQSLPEGFTPEDELRFNEAFTLKRMDLKS